MFAAARQERIKDLLLKHKQFDVASLAATLGVTEVTIRRDLDKLEQEGFIIKTHGGAILKDLPSESAFSSERVSREIIELGEAASLLVKNNEAIFIGSGLTCQQVALNLHNKQRLTVMTNDLKVALELKEAPGVFCTVTGGNNLPGTESLVGDLALRALQEVHFRRAIISPSGISFNSGYSANTVEEALFYRQLFNRCEEAIIVADYRKFNKVGFSQIAKLTAAHKIVTNKEVDDRYKEYYFQQNIKLFTPYAVEEGQEVRRTDGDQSGDV
ncbi:MAG TPA: DeoR/GlpR transcriptional regulator [Firmicutes bacterium]|nr:DeoR/GlpR transcriptional regulator [Bacillota bacterium]